MKLNYIFLGIFLVLSGCKKGEEATVPYGKIYVGIYEYSDGRTTGDWGARLFLFKNKGQELITDPMKARFGQFNDKSTGELVKPSYKFEVEGNAFIEVNVPQDDYIVLAVSDQYQCFSFKNIKIDSEVKQFEKTFYYYNIGAVAW